ncbi:MAG: hypothetical protein IIZ39_03640 [Blautia sp.]|nr:hypothetical protein [Blautia sp.]
MKGLKKYALDILVVIVLIVIAAVMFRIGRGHTIYFDNKPLTAEGQTYDSWYQVEVFVEDERVAKLKAGDRGMVSVMGQDFKMVLHLKADADAKKTGSAVTLKLPYDMDGIILNIPALLGGAGEDVYMSEFIPAPVVEEEEEVILTDEFVMSEE